MQSMINHLKPDFQEKVLGRWSKLLDAGKPIKDEKVKLATALCLENTQREFDKLTESYTAGSGGMGAQAGTNLSPNGGGAFGTATNYGVNDSRIPSIVIPTLRRIFPELVAHNLVGVQPMNAPVSFAYAIRFQQGPNAGGITGTTNQGNEIGYSPVDSHHTGTSGLAAEDNSGNFMATVNGAQAGTTTNNSYWEAFAGASTAPGTDGRGNTLAGSEWLAIGEDMPMTQFRLEKGVVEAKSRKLAAHWSLELEEDMMNMHGIDVDSEMVNVMSYEVQAEIDRQLLGEMIKASIVGGTTSDWSPVSADGRNQLERIGTIYTQVLIKSQRIATLTRRGPATFAVASPTVVALLERLGDFTLDTASVTADHAQVGISQVGSMRNGGITLYRDTHTPGNYCLLGYKGATPYDAGIIYCPYIPIQLNRATGQEDFTPRIGVRTRYGVLANLFGSANYYQFIKVDGLLDAGLASGSRVFTY